VIARSVRPRALAALLLLSPVAYAEDDPLPSWNDGAPKRAIVEFVADAGRPGASTFIPIPERVATFDNDGTLWAEQPLYFQLAFALDRVKALAPEHPEWKEKQPFKAALDGDVNWAYDRTSDIGRLDTALDEAATRKWTIVDMKLDWKRVFPFDQK
jgi:hypothetical protein